MQSEYGLRFSSSFTPDVGSFKLLELPAELCKLVEDSLASATPIRYAIHDAPGPQLTRFIISRFSIKGETTEDAVLCTEDKTYAIRSVVLSNSVLVVTRDVEEEWEDEGGTVVIRDTLNEILELTATVPKMAKLSSLLRGREYTGEEEMDIVEEVRADSLDTCMIAHLTRFQESERLTLAEAKATIQASDIELAVGLKLRHILDINGTHNILSRSSPFPSLTHTF